MNLQSQLPTTKARENSSDLAEKTQVNLLVLKKYQIHLMLSFTKTSRLSRSNLEAYKAQHKVLTLF